VCRFIGISFGDVFFLLSWVNLTRGVSKENGKRKGCLLGRRNPCYVKTVKGFLWDEGEDGCKMREGVCICKYVKKMVGYAGGESKR
jgi:hypothetical protein